MTAVPPRLLVDTAVLDGRAAAFPLPWLDGFATLPYPPRALEQAAPEALLHADAVLVRSMTLLGADQLALLPSVRAVATLSSGTDHLDEPLLKDLGLPVHTGLGGNARAVADWVQWACTRLMPRTPDHAPRALVVGVGAVGKLVAARLEELGCTVLLCDPPRQLREPTFAGCTLDDALAFGVDVLTVHVPLTQRGPDATVNLLDDQRLQALCLGRRPVLLNAARGGIVHEVAVADMRRTGRLAGLALDTFCAEPRPDHAVVAACDLATPHIAGHSIAGKLDVARRALAGLRRQFGLPALPPLTHAVSEAVQALPAATVPDSFAGLDQAARDFAGYPSDPDCFERLRHSHKRSELRPLPAEDAVG